MKRRKKSKDKPKMDVARLLSEGFNIGLWVGVASELADEHCDESHSPET